MSESVASLAVTEADNNFAQQQQQQHLTALNTDSNDYAFLEYFLRLSMHASTARIMTGWEVSNPQLTLQFEKRSRGLLTIDSWLDVTGLPEGCSEDELLRRGFTQQAGANGLKFGVGQINLPEGSEGDEPIRKRFILCKVAIGRAYHSTDDFAKIATIPEGYDSFVLDKHENADQLEYVVKDASQVLPTYVVCIEFDPAVERRSRQQVACENCEAAPATVFCQADAASLCSACDASMHASKLASRHVRIALANGPQAFACCRTHPDKIVEFFCPACSKPVCVHCKMVGHHSVGEAARHKLVTVAEAFRSVSEASVAADPVLDSRRQAIQKQMDAVAVCSKSVEDNAEQVQAALEELMNRAKADLKNIARKKINILKGDVIELNRQLAELSRLESFLEYQKAGGNATQFILDWAHHQRLRSELHSFTHFRQAIDVQPDIRIHGAIQVHVESAGLPLASAAAQGDAASQHYEHVSSMKASALFEQGAKPKYPQARARPLPTFDLGVYAKNRKASDYVVHSNTQDSN